MLKTICSTYAFTSFNYPTMNYKCYWNSMQSLAYISCDNTFIAKRSNYTIQKYLLLFDETIRKPLPHLVSDVDRAKSKGFFLHLKALQSSNVSKLYLANFEVTKKTM